MYAFRDILKFKIKYLSQQRWLISLVFVIDTWFIDCEASWFRLIPNVESSKSKHTRTVITHDMYSCFGLCSITRQDYVTSNKLAFFERHQKLSITSQSPLLPHPNTVNCFFVIKPTRYTNLTNLFWHETLHVSDSSFVHHQEYCYVRHVGLTL
jgi:hypothetical protein